MAGMPGPYGPAQQPPVPTYGPPPMYAPPVMPYAMPYAMPYPPRPRRFSPRQIGGLVVGILGVLLLIGALLGTWWSVGMSLSGGGFGITLPMNFGLFGGSANFLIVTIPLNYAGQVASVFLLTAILVFAGLLLAVVSTVVGFVSRAAGLRWVSVGLAAGAFALAVTAPLYVMVALPSAQSGNPLFSDPLIGGGNLTTNFNGFWGSGSLNAGGSTFQLTWGAGFAWYLSIVAGVLVLIAGILFAPSRTSAPAEALPGTSPSVADPSQAPSPMPGFPPPSPPPPGVGP